MRFFVFVALWKVRKCFLRYRAGDDGPSGAIYEIAEMFFALPHGEDANAEFQRGLVTPLGSDAKGKEGLVNALGHLTSHSLPFGNPSLAR